MVRQTAPKQEEAIEKQQWKAAEFEAQLQDEARLNTLIAESLGRVKCGWRYEIQP